MFKKSMASIALAFTFFAPSLVADPIVHELNNESLEVAELIVNLSKSIVNDLNPPVTGAERIVTNATVTDEGTTRTFYIEGKDVYHTGRVTSTYWIRLHKQIRPNNATTAAISYPLDDEAKTLVGALLNSLYDVAEFELDHRRVILDRIYEINSDNAQDPWTFEIHGVNQVCAHTELNTFKITVSRILQRNRPIYTSEIVIPYSPEPGDNDTIVFPPSAPGDFIEFPPSDSIELSYNR